MPFDFESLEVYKKAKQLNEVKFMDTPFERPPIAPSETTSGKQIKLPKRIQPLENNGGFVDDYNQNKRLKSLNYYKTAAQYLREQKNIILQRIVI